MLGSVRRMDAIGATDLTLVAWLCSEHRRIVCLFPHLAAFACSYTHQSWWSRPEKARSMLISMLDIIQMCSKKLYIYIHIYIYTYIFIYTILWFESYKASLLVCATGSDLDLRSIPLELHTAACGGCMQRSLKSACLEVFAPKCCQPWHVRFSQRSGCQESGTSPTAPSPLRLLLPLPF